MPNIASPDVNARITGDQYLGWTPLHSAILTHKADMVTLLLKNHGDPNARIATNYVKADLRGYTPLVLTAADGESGLQKHTAPCATRNTQHKADVNARNSAGETPLHWAAGAGLKPAAELLLANKADPNIRTEDGKTALDFAKANINIPGDWVNRPGGWTKPTQSIEFVRPQDAGPGFGHLMRLLTPGATATGQASERIETALKSHGALEEFPDFSSIRIMRKGVAKRYVVFNSPTNHLNQFTLIEVIANFYGADTPNYTYGPISSPTPERPMRRPPMTNVSVLLPNTAASHVNQFPTLPNPHRPHLPPPRVLPPLRIPQPPYIGPLPFPDFAKIVIHRPGREHSSRQTELTINLSSGTNSLDCRKDVPLRFGDVVEIPEREHTLAERSVGLTAEQRTAINTCLERKITFLIRDQPAEFVLHAYTSDTYLSPALKSQAVQAILRSSSDFSRIRIKRRDPATNKTNEFLVNEQALLDGKEPLSNDWWLRDGNVVEVPDKP